MAKKLSKEKLEKLFDEHDFNKDSTIDYKEVKPILKKLGFTEANIEQYSLDLVCIYVKRIYVNVTLCRPDLNFYLLCQWPR